nr:hybrid sensor histidine kinase/response regulator [Bradyrhizobium tropiciagri]
MPNPDQPPRGNLFFKYLVSFVAVTAIALVASVTIDGWFSYVEQNRLLGNIQREKAEAAAGRIGRFVIEIRNQLGWLTQLPAGIAVGQDPRIDAIRVMRLNPAVAEITILDAQGHERLHVSSRDPDRIGSGEDFSGSEAFRAVKANGAYYGPVYFARETEPHMRLGLAAGGKNGDVILAEVNLRFVWEVVSAIKVGSSGNAYALDEKGRVVAHPDLRQVLRRTDLSTLPQVRAAISGGDEAAAEEGISQISGKHVLSAYARVPLLGWPVFVELPLREAYATIYRSALRSVLLLFVLLVCAVLAAWLLSRRMVVPIHALARSASLIGRGQLDQRISIKTGDELESLGGQFNSMAEQLQQSYATLEQRVVDRTAELAAARDTAMAEHAAAERARNTAELANAAKSRFLAVISHELRTPMNGVLGVLQLLDTKERDPEQRRLLDIANASGDTLIKLIDTILDYARLEAGTEALEPRAFELRRTIETVAGLMRPQAEAKGLVFDLELDIPDAPMVIGDPVRLNRILFNLLSNAIKFTSTGRIRLGATWQQDREAGKLTVSVTDTGIGIAPEQQQRIFTDFTQADGSIARRFGGTGLGLAIARGLAQLMKGSLTVESVAGAGSTFRLSVPLPLAGPERRPAAPPAVSRPLTVLLVDDDPINRDVAEAMLHRLGHHVTQARDGAMAIELAKATRFDVILMDLHMPVIDGFDAAAAILANADATRPRIIAVTADVSEDTRRRGIDTFIRKPVMLDALESALSFADSGLAAAAPPSLASTEFIDEPFLDGQLELLGQVRLRRLRDIFATSAGQLFAQMQEAACGGDRAGVKQAIHRLGSAAAALGMSRLFVQCGELEEAARTGHFAHDASIAALRSLERQSLAGFDGWLEREEIASESLVQQ